MPVFYVFTFVHCTAIHNINHSQIVNRACPRDGDTIRQVSIRARGARGPIFFYPTLVPGSVNFQLSRLACLGYGLSRLSMERVLDALLLAALLFAARVNKSSADKPFP